MVSYPMIEATLTRAPLVTFLGGPCHGSFEVGSGKTQPHIAAALAVEKLKTTAHGDSCRFWGGICSGKADAHNYSVTKSAVVDGRLEIVCQYLGDED